MGAGFPDYGLYSAQQGPKTEMGKLTPEIIAERGVIEAKAPGESVEIVAGNRGALRQDWPRVPVPADPARLAASAALGREVAALLDGERGVAGVTEGSLRAELRVIGAARRAGGGGLSDDDLRITAGWGHAERNRITMPGRGEARERDYTPLERAALKEGKKGDSPLYFQFYLYISTYYIFIPYNTLKINDNY